MTDFSKLSTQGPVKIFRQTDDELIGIVFIELEDGALTLSAVHTLVPREESAVLASDEPLDRERPRFINIEDAIAWVKTNPHLPDPTLADSNVVKTWDGLVRRVWRTPNGCAIAFPATRARILRHYTPRYGTMVAVLLDQQDNVIGYVRFSAIGDSWYVNEPGRDRFMSRVRRAASFERAIERLAAAGLAYRNTPSAHEQLELANSRAERMEIFHKALTEGFPKLVAHAGAARTKRKDASEKRVA